MMRVLNVLRDLAPIGGKQRYALDLAELLQTQGHHVTLFAMGDSTPGLAAAELIPRLPVDSPRLLTRFLAGCARLYNISAKRSIMAIARRSRFDIAHLHDHAHFSTALLDGLAEMGIPVVYTLHDHQWICPVSVLFRERDGVPCEACKGRRYYQAVLHRCSHGKLANSAISALDTLLFDLRRAVQKVRLFIAPSHFLKRKFVEFGWDARQIEVVPHFASPRWQSAQPAPADGPILCVARLWRQKGVHVLLEALRRLGAKSFNVVVVGDGPERENLVRQAAAARLQGVYFVGHLDGIRLRSAYESARWVVVPSIGPEVFGLVCTEAFASGRPVVASDIGGLSEIVSHGIDGLLCQPNDPDELAERLDWMLTHPSEVRDMGEAARQKVERHYTPEQHYLRISQIYHAVIKER